MRNKNFWILLSNLLNFIAIYKFLMCLFENVTFEKCLNILGTPFNLQMGVLLL